MKPKWWRQGLLIKRMEEIAEEAYQNAYKYDDMWTKLMKAKKKADKNEKV